jgi:DNA-binding LytR/AlgR family response regulator
MKRPLKYIAVDDEPLALLKIDEFASQIPFLEKVNLFKSGIEAITFLKDNTIDLAFMDINMEGLNGLQTIELLNPRPLIIITTAYSQHAVKGFELDVCDYLLKPFSLERFVKAVNRAYELVCASEKPLQIIDSKEEKKEYVFLKTEHQIQRVLLNEILFIKGMGDYLQIKLSDRKIMVLMNFSEIGNLLPQKSFMRIHRSYLINLDKITSIGRNFVFINDNRIPISNSHKEQFLTYLKKENLM